MSNAEQRHPVEVVRAEVADTSIVARLLHDFNVEYDSPTPSMPTLTRRFATLLEREDVLVLLARDASGRDGVHGTELGFAMVTWRPSAYHDGGTALLEELYVRPSVRDRGVGTALLAGMFAWVDGRGIGEVQINVDETDVDARRFYERHGFTNLEVNDLTTSRMLLYVRELESID